MRDRDQTRRVGRGRLTRPLKHPWTGVREEVPVLQDDIPPKHGPKDKKNRGETRRRERK